MSALLAAEQLLAQRRLHGLPRLFTRAQQAGADPDRCAAGRWMAYMLRGDYEQAWQESDAIRVRGNTDPHRVWTGEPVDGRRVLLRSLHGFGDAIQCLRFVPALRNRAAHVTLEVAPHLLPLAQCIPGPHCVIPWEAQPPAWEVQVEVTELPYLLRTTVDALPPPVSISLPPSLLQKAHAALGPCTQPAVGLVWSSGGWNPARSIPWSSIAGMIKGVRCSFWNLQGGPERWCAAGILHDAPELCDAGLLPMAAMLTSLDLLVTPDTLAAHLAASLGTPTWLVLQKEADWRWMTARRRSPWYPAMQIFRNRRQDGWEETLQRVRAALLDFRAGFMQRRRLA